MVLPVFSAIAGIAKSIGKVSVSKAKAFGGAIKESTTAIKDSGMDSILQGIVSIFRPFIKLLDSISIIFKVIGAQVQAALAPAMSKFFEILMSPEVMGAFVQLGETIGKFLAPLMNLLVGIFQKFAESGILQRLVDGIAILAEFLGRIFGMALESILNSGILDAVILFLTMIAEAFAQFMGWLESVGFFDFIETVFVIIVKAIEWFVKNAGPIIEHIGVVLGRIWNIIVDGFTWFGEVLTWVWEGIIVPVWDAIVAGFTWFGSVLAGIWNGIVFVFKGFVNGIIGVINFIINAVNLVIGFFSLGLLKIPEIPYLQTGGNVERTGVAVVHAGEQVLNVATVKAIHDLISEIGDKPAAVNQRNYAVNISAMAFDDESIENLAREVYKQQLLFG